MTHAESIPEQLARGRREAEDVAGEMGGIACDFAELVPTEGRLAKAEMGEQVSLAVRGAIWGAVAAILALIALVFVFITVFVALDLAMPQWAAALVTTGIILLFTSFAGLMAKSLFRRLTVVPKKTISSVQEDIQWAKAQLKSSSRRSANGTP